MTLPAWHEGETLLTRDDVQAQTSLSTRTINRLRRRAVHPFPQPVSDGYRHYWKQSEVEAWLVRWFAERGQS